MALISGMPAASSEPNVTISTTAANARPNTSVTDGPNAVFWNTCPVKATCMPAASPMEAVRCSASSVAAFTPACPVENCTDTIAARWFRGDGVHRVLAEGAADRLDAVDPLDRRDRVGRRSLRASPWSIRVPAGATSDGLRARAGRLREHRVEAVERGLRLRAGDREPVAELAAEAEAGAGDGEDDHEPGREHAPGVGVARAGRAGTGTRSWVPSSMSGFGATAVSRGWGRVEVRRAGRPGGRARARRARRSSPARTCVVGHVVARPAVGGDEHERGAGERDAEAERCRARRRRRAAAAAARSRTSASASSIDRRGRRAPGRG